MAAVLNGQTFGIGAVFPRCRNESHHREMSAGIGQRSVSGQVSAADRIMRAGR